MTGELVAEDEEGPGVDDLLPAAEGSPILYDCDIAVLAKNDDAAANILDEREENSRYDARTGVMVCRKA